MKRLLGFLWRAPSDPNARADCSPDGFEFGLLQRLREAGL